MATRIRLRRVGRKKIPLYRIVVADGEAPRDGRFIEVIGTYDPKGKTSADKVKVDADKARQYTETAMEMANGAVEQLKTLSFSLRPAQLDLLGLVAAVQSAVQRVAEPAGLAFEVCSRGEEPRPLGSNAAVAMRLVQEALTNIIRHAKATRIAVRLRFLPQERIGVLVVDDGVGFDPEASEPGYGLPAMRARVLRENAQRPTSQSMPRARAASSVSPTIATSGMA